MCHLLDSCRVGHAEHHECEQYYGGALHVLASVGRQLPSRPADSGIGVEVAGESESTSLKPCEVRKADRKAVHCTVATDDIRAPRSRP